MNRVVPVTMEGGGLDTQSAQFDTGHAAARGILPLVEAGVDAQARLRGRSADQLDDDLAADQRAPAPVLGDVTEHAMLDLIPLARPRWEVADGDAQPRLRGQLVELGLPQAGAVAVAAARVGENQQGRGPRVRAAPHAFPPAADRFDGELRGVVVGPDADPAMVAGQIVHAVRDYLAQLGVDEVMNLHPLRLSFGSPFPPRILEVAHQLLLLRIDRDDRLPAALKGARLPINVLELGVAIGMAGSLARLAVGLQAVLEGLQ